jgi:hypothetical protein
MSGAGLQVIDAGQPATLSVGEVAPGIEGLLGVDGRRYDLDRFAAAPILVLVFVANRCPTVHAYRDRLNRLAREHAPAGVQLVALNSNDPHLYPEESFPRMIAFAREMGWPFPYLQDSGQAVARAYGPTRTFHVFVLDQERRLRYQGRFDDARLEERVTSPDLVHALGDLLAGRPVRVPDTTPFGCSLDYV